MRARLKGKENQKAAGATRVYLQTSREIYPGCEKNEIFRLSEFLKVFFVCSFVVYVVCFSVFCNPGFPN